jgi:hypothetical protein
MWTMFTHMSFSGVKAYIMDEGDMSELAEVDFL